MNGNEGTIMFKDIYCGYCLSSFKRRSTDLILGLLGAAFIIGRRLFRESK